MPSFIRCAGFSLFLLADILCFHADTALSSFVSLEGDAYAVLSITMRLATLAAFALACLLRGEKTSSIVRRAPLFAGVLFAGGALASAAPIPAAQCADACGLACMAAAQAMLNLAWLSHVGTLSYKNAYLFLLGGHALATVLCALLLEAAGSYLTIATVVAFLLSCLAAFLTRNASEKTDRAFSLEQLRCTAPVLGRGVCAVGLFAFVSGFVGAIDPPENDVLMQWITLGVSAAVVAIMSLPALLLKQPLKLENSYRLALPLSALGFLVLPGLAAGAPAGIAGVFSTTGYMVCGIVLYCTIAEVCRAAGLPSAALYAASETAVLTLLLFGRFCGGIASMVMPRDAAGFVVVAFGCLYLGILGMSWLLGRESAARRTHDAAQAAPCVRASQDAHGSMAAMAEYYGLDERERAVFMQLAQGRSIPRIAQDCYLSPSAIKYHVQKIYRKLDIHTRGELAALVRHPFFLDAMPKNAMCRDIDACAAQSESSGRPSREGTCEEGEQVRFASTGEEALARFGLTERERDVFVLLAGARTVDDIARRLEISENTVKTHIKRIYKKMDVHSKQDVIDFALKHGIRF